MTTIWTPEQQKEHRAKWVRALRSGKYKQTTDELFRPGIGFCCLGVACDISKLGAWEGHRYSTTDFQSDGELADDIMEWLGLRHPAGAFGTGKPGESLAEMNDQGKPFEVIADIIESEPPGLIANA